MQLVFERDEDKVWHCKMYWPFNEDMALMIEAVAEGSQHLDHDPYEIFSLAVKNFPRKAKELDWIGQNDWQKLIEPVYVVPPMKPVYQFSGDITYDDVVITQVRITFKTPRHVEINSLMWELENPGGGYEDKFLPPAAGYKLEAYKELELYKKAMLDSYVNGKVESSLEAKYVGNGGNEVMSELGKYFDMKQKIECHKDCPDDGGDIVSLATYVWHLNDKQGWTIDEIAEHLEELPINIQMKENAVKA